MEPVSHFFYSHRLKLQFWDFGNDGKPSLILVHGGLDHARSWDWVARELRQDFHVYALDLRGHGNSAWAPGALYSPAEHVLDLSALADIINDFPVYIIGHSLGAVVTLLYAGIYPDKVKSSLRLRERVRRLRCSDRQRLPNGCANGSNQCAMPKAANRAAIPICKLLWRG